MRDPEAEEKESRAEKLLKEIVKDEKFSSLIKDNNLQI